ncbi:MAG: 2-hydroxyacyl-CoA dehydratase [Deltaproteobacteria bacterium]|nr:MAG: 2-hydroxyacyl-CoA dehydratase [Deltaproteobacteria bacterium]
MGSYEIFARNRFTTTPYYLAKVISLFAGLTLSIGPLNLRRYFRQYKWLARPNRQLDLMKEARKNRSREYWQGMFEVVYFLLRYLATVLKGATQEPEKLIWHEDLVPPEIIHAMGLVPFCVEAPGIILPELNAELTEYFIDVAENSGYPGDICSLPKSTIGLIMEDQFPPPRAIISSNSPCDGGMASYLPIEQKLNVPVFRLDLPYNFTQPKALEYYEQEVKSMIEFLERRTGKKLDYDRLKEVCEERNRAYEYTLDTWDMIKSRPAPIGSEVLFYSHLCYPLYGGGRISTELMRNICDIARRIISRGGAAIPNEKYRVILWNPPPLIFPEIFIWMEYTYGAIMVMDMITYNRHPFIDTTSKESMLRDLATIMAYGPMARHTRGPVENFFGDLFRIYREFQADMIMMAAHIGCKNTRAVLRMFREYCRRDNIPLLVFDYDLSDTRITSPDGIKRQIADFMDNVMGHSR